MGIAAALIETTLLSLKFELGPLADMLKGGCL